ncbi:AMIN-like domain-containing (lipo)protein [Kitasatospora terrestris]
MRRLLVVSMALAVTGAGAVAAPAAFSAPAPAAAAATVSCPVGWGSLPEDRTGDPLQPLTGVRTGRHDCYDRIVLDVPGSSAARPVGYHVRYVPALVQDGSGAIVPVAGGAILEIVAEAPAYDPATGAVTYPALAGQPLPGVDLTGYRTLRDAKFGGSFEGRTQLGIGVRARLPFRVFPLDGRLVVDVAHSWTATAAAG